MPHYSKDQIVPFYKDWQENREQMGHIKLIEWKGEGRTFVPKWAEDGYMNYVDRNHHCFTYMWEKWIGQIVDLTPKGEAYYGLIQGQNVSVNLRFLYVIGLTPTKDSEESLLDEKNYTYTQIDKFLEIEGIQIY